MIRMFFVLIFLILFPVTSQAIERELHFMFWYNITPPTEDATEFFDGVSKSVNMLNSNNNEIKTNGNKKGVALAGNKHASKILNTLLKKIILKKTFFTI
jgi:hypothetical protein